MNITFLVSVVGFWVTLLVTMHEVAGVRYFFGVIEFLFIFAGMTSIIFGSVNMHVLKDFPKFVKLAFLKIPYDSAAKAKRITEYSLEVKKNGKLSIEGLLEKEPCEFTKNVFRSFLDGMSAEDIEEMYFHQIEFIEARHKTVIAMFEKLSESSGIMGLVGTLTGLIAMLLNMSDPSSIGPAMAVALLTTLYAAVVPIGFSTPVANKLHSLNEAEVFDKEISVNGVLYILNGDNPRIVEQKLMGGLAPYNRTTIFDSK